MPSRCSKSRRSTSLSQAANDLNFTFVVDENQGDRLVEQLHDLLIRPAPGDRVMGPTWEQLFAKPEAVAARAQPWWATKREALLGRCAAARQRLCLRPRRRSKRPRSPSRGLKSVGRALYALKANPHPDILRTRGRAGRGLRLRIAGRDRARARVRARASSANEFCSRRTSRRARSTSARWRWASTSPSTTCSCCSTGWMRSRARACSCASTPASAAVITIT